MAFVERFDMYDVQKLLGIETLAEYGDSRYIVCPYCGAKKRSCNINENFFKCLKCGKQGNYYQLYADLMNITGADGKTATQVARQEILKALSIDSFVTQRKKPEREKKPEIPKRTPEELDVVYRSLISHLTLSDKHRKALRKRGLSDRQINGYGFRSVDLKKSQEICRLMIKDGMSLERVPGFYRNHGNWDILFMHEGYLCPVFDTDVKLIGFQVRFDELVDGQKYKWLSSNNREGGMTSGSPAAYYGPKDRCETVYVVDGILKALVCRCLAKRKDIGFLGVPGVNNYKNCRAAIEKLQTKGLKNVVNAFDMDEYIDPTCKHDHKKCKGCPCYDTHYKKSMCEHKKLKVDGLNRGSVRLQETCKELGLRYLRHTWDLENGLWNEQIKGFDDYLLEIILKRMN